MAWVSEEFRNKVMELYTPEIKDTMTRGQFAKYAGEMLGCSKYHVAKVLEDKDDSWFKQRKKNRKSVKTIGNIAIKSDNDTENYDDKIFQAPMSHIRIAQLKGELFSYKSENDMLVIESSDSSVKIHSKNIDIFMVELQEVINLFAGGAMKP